MLFGPPSLCNAVRRDATPANAATAHATNGPRDEKTTSFGPMVRQACATLAQPHSPQANRNTRRPLPFLGCVFSATTRSRVCRTMTPCRASARHGVVFPIAMWIQWRYVPLCPPPPLWPPPPEPPPLCPPPLWPPPVPPPLPPPPPSLPGGR